MKIITIGDVQGRDYWKVINPDQYDKIIFVGDYPDDNYIPDDVIIENLTNIIKFKKQNMDKVELLLGNHDIHYLYYFVQPCTRYNDKIDNILKDIYKQNKTLFKLAYQYKNYLWTHAGIHDQWFHKNYKSLFETRIKNNINDEYSTILNELYFEDDPFYLKKIFEIGTCRGGWEKYGGPLWADENEFHRYKLLDIHQITGHNRVKKIKTYDGKNIIEHPFELNTLQKSVTFTDVQDQYWKYKLPADDNIFLTMEIK